MDNDGEGYQETELLLASLDQSELETPLSNFTPDLNLSNLRGKDHRFVQPKQASRAQEELKYKYSLVSVLVVSVVLLMSVNIGLGFRKCKLESTSSHNSGHISEVPGNLHADLLLETSQCMDEKSEDLFAWQQYRLPTFAEPDLYEIFLHPNITEQTYSGHVVIHIRVVQPTEFLVLHSAGHEIVSMSLVDDDEETVDDHDLSVSKCASSEQIAVRFSNGTSFLAGNVYKLNATFTGSLDPHGLYGFYLSSYEDSNNQTVSLASTQFESVHARKAFPCFDEPIFKANFSLAVVREQRHSALFNTPRVSTNEYGGDDTTGLLVDTFETTEKMSSYLVAFIISEFASKSTTTEHGLKVSVWSRPEVIDQTEYALGIATSVLQEYNSLFGIPYPLSKLDLVAIPDFAAGAMENWGLITYRETALLYDEETSDLSDKQWVAKVIAHELAHQWFGNLVTMQWWDDLWLNEGFASFMEYQGVAAVEPSWNYMDYFASTHINRAMSTDSYSSTHPVSSSVTKEEEIDEMFDVISYDKGASLIYMLVDWLGEDDFYQGIRNYLRKFSYKNTVHTDLIECLAEASGKDPAMVQTMMKSWIENPGVPLVHVAKSEKSSQLELGQQRFSYDLEDSSDELVWHIPLSLVTNLHPDSTRHKMMNDSTATIDVNSAVDWVKLNHNRAGYYKVSYDASLWQSLIQQCETNSLVFTVADRSGLVNDAFTSARIGALTYEALFNLTSSIVAQETDFTPLSSVLSGFSYIYYTLSVRYDSTQSVQLLEDFLKDMLAPLYTKYAWKDKAGLIIDEQQIQSLVLDSMCSYGYEPCVSRASSIFQDWMVNDTQIEADFISTVLSTVIKRGSTSDWDALWSRYKGTNDPSLKSKMLSALSTSSQQDKMYFLLEEMLQGEDVRIQDQTTVVRGTTSSYLGAVITWKFVRKYWRTLVDQNELTSFAMRHIIDLCAVFQDMGDRDAALKFYQDQGIAEMKSVKKAIEVADTRLKWHGTFHQDIKEFLEKSIDEN